MSDPTPTPTLTSAFASADPATQALIDKALRAMGNAKAHPRKADRTPPKGLKAQPWGQKRRQQGRREETFYPAFEQTVRAHRGDPFHMYNPRFTNEAGWPDYVIFGIGWHAFVELKARSIVNPKRIGKLDTDQRRWQRSIEEAGGEYQVFVLPDDWKAIDAWLSGHSGRHVDVSWRATA